jgi:hypothetical protein
MSVTLKADSLTRQKITWRTPAAEGTYYLAAVLERDGALPVVSQRTIRSVHRGRALSPLHGRRVLVLGADSIVVDWLRDSLAKVTTCLTTDKVQADVVLIWNASSRSDTMTKALGRLKEFAASGGRIVVADRTDWVWKELADCEIGLPDFLWQNPVACSRAHRFEGAEHPVLQDIPADCLWRWNGLPGEIANEAILAGPDLENGRKLLWASKPAYTMLLSVPVGQGEVLFCQLKIRERITPDGVGGDPVAERLLANMLTR